MACFYMGSWGGLYTTAYGIMLVAKIYLLLAMIALGAGNWFLVRRLASDPKPLLARLRRVVEAEVCLGFLAVMTAASLTAQAPPVDVNARHRLTSHEIYVRLHPEPPRMSSPPLAALAPPSSLAVAVQDSQFIATVGSDDTDRSMVGVQPALGRADCADRRAVGAVQPAPLNALGSVLAVELCGFSRLHPAAR
jgi:putative copper resistance protein D